jgi:hypothetical protein
MPPLSQPVERGRRLAAMFVADGRALADFTGSRCPAHVHPALGMSSRCRPKTQCEEGRFSPGWSNVSLPAPRSDWPSKEPWLPLPRFLLPLRARSQRPLAHSHRDSRSRTCNQKDSRRKSPTRDWSLPSRLIRRRLAIRRASPSHDSRPNDCASKRHASHNGHPASHGAMQRRGQQTRGHGATQRRGQQTRGHGSRP